MSVEYRRFENSYCTAVSELIQSLYSKDPGDKPMLPEKIAAAFDALTSKPDPGTIMESIK